MRRAGNCLGRTKPSNLLATAHQSAYASRFPFCFFHRISHHLKFSCSCNRPFVRPQPFFAGSAEGDRLLRAVCWCCGLGLPLGPGGASVGNLGHRMESPEFTWVRIRLTKKVTHETPGSADPRKGLLRHLLPGRVLAASSCTAGRLPLMRTPRARTAANQPLRFFLNSPLTRSSARGHRLGCGRRGKAAEVWQPARVTRAR